jgi:hypothetical protein
MLALSKALLATYNCSSALEVLTGAFVFGRPSTLRTGGDRVLDVLSWDVSKAYPLVGLGFALTVPLGMMAGENVTAARVAGVVLICTGVWMVART